MAVAPYSMPMEITVCAMTSFEPFKGAPSMELKEAVVVAVAEVVVVAMVTVVAWAPKGPVALLVGSRVFREFMMPSILRNAEPVSVWDSPVLEWDCVLAVVVSVIPAAASVDSEASEEVVLA